MKSFPPPSKFATGVLQAMKSQRGFTLIELMVAMAIAMILLAVGAPNLRGTLQNNRSTAMANDFVSVVNFARSEAVKRGREVRLTTVNPDAADNEWGPGWRVWIDTNGNNVYNAGIDEELRVREALEGNATLDSGENAGEVRFRANGFTNIPAAQVRSFLLRLPGCTGDQGRTITVVPTGHASVARVACA
jgi:type IV fimbrial biogenesis protein FimT